MSTNKKNTIDDFDKWIDKSRGCWLWTGGHMKSGGYGRFTLNGKRWRAHVLSYTIHNETVPEGLCVLHKCDVPNCVNPEHLFLGTQLDNIEDMHKKGRTKGTFPKGVEHFKTNLSEADVLAIRSEFKPRVHGVKKMLAEKYKTTPTAVMWIVSRLSWRHI